MTATCTYAPEAVDSTLGRLRDVTRRLHHSQADTRTLAGERRALIAALRAEGVTLETIGAVMGATPQTVWGLCRDAREEVAAR
ncbi:MAG: hypothetical protein WAV90_23005 [Gordonia amarae]